MHYHPVDVDTSWALVQHGHITQRAKFTLQDLGAPHEKSIIEPITDLLLGNALATSHQPGVTRTRRMRGVSN